MLVVIIKSYSKFIVSFMNNVRRILKIVLGREWTRFSFLMVSTGNFTQITTLFFSSDHQIVMLQFCYYHLVIIYACGIAKVLC